MKESSEITTNVKALAEILEKRVLIETQRTVKVYHLNSSLWPAGIAHGQSSDYNLVVEFCPATGIWDIMILKQNDGVMVKSFQSLFILEIAQIMRKWLDDESLFTGNQINQN
jgi:hypothetical protein